MVNCTGPRDDVRRRDSAAAARPADLRPRPARRPLGLGLATDPDGRLVARRRHARRPGLWALGALRRGAAVRVDRHPGDPGAGAATWRPRSSPSCRPRRSAAVRATGTGWRCQRLTRGGHRLRHGAGGPAARAVRRRDLPAARRGRSIRASRLAHAGLALLGHEWGAAVDVEQSLDRAVEAVRVRGDERERSFVAAIEARIRRPGPEAAGAAADPHPPLRRGRARGEHRRTRPSRSAARPRCRRRRGRSWRAWPRRTARTGGTPGMLAFIRQEQERWDEATELSERALAEVPSSGHAVHARAHVYLRDRGPRRGPGLPRPVDRLVRARRVPSRALRLARRPARAGDGRRRRRAPPLRRAARAAGRVRHARPGRLRLAAVAGPAGRGLGGSGAGRAGAGRRRPGAAGAPADGVRRPARGGRAGRGRRPGRPRSAWPGGPPPCPTRSWSRSSLR